MHLNYEVKDNAGQVDCSWDEVAPYAASAMHPICIHYGDTLQSSRSGRHTSTGAMKLLRTILVVRVELSA